MYDDTSSHTHIRQICRVISACLFHQPTNQPSIHPSFHLAKDNFTWNNESTLNTLPLLRQTFSAHANFEYTHHHHHFSPAQAVVHLWRWRRHSFTCYRLAWFACRAAYSQPISAEIFRHGNKGQETKERFGEHNAKLGSCCLFSLRGLYKGLVMVNLLLLLLKDAGDVDNKLRPKP